MKNDPDRKVELLIDRALFGLNENEADELNLLINKDRKQSADRFDENAEQMLMHGEDDFDQLTAKLELSSVEIQPVPESIVKKLKEEGRHFLRSVSSDARESNDAPDQRQGQRKAHQNDQEASTSAVAQQQEHPTPHSLQRARPSIEVREWFAWTAVAVLFIFGFALWFRSGSTESDLRSQLKQARGDLESTRSRLESELDDSERAKSALQIQMTNLQTETQRLKSQLNPDGAETFRQVAARDDVIRWKWTDLKNTGVTGEVVWDEKRQEGAMRFVGMEENDPAQKQYQLWIIEANGRKHPVDGGVFNIQSSGEVYVPIKPTLFAQSPAAFAITVEEPAGVVVSEREDLPLIAKAVEE